MDWPIGKLPDRLLSISTFLSATRKSNNNIPLPLWWVPNCACRAVTSSSDTWRRVMRPHHFACVLGTPLAVSRPLQNATKPHSFMTPRLIIGWAYALVLKLEGRCCGKCKQMADACSSAARLQPSMSAAQCSLVSAWCHPQLTCRLPDTGFPSGDWHIRFSLHPPDLLHRHPPIQGSSASLHWVFIFPA